MIHYAITVSADADGQEYRVVLRGPGIDLDGRRYVFATTPRAQAFADAVNFAYEQGLRDGRTNVNREDGRLLIVTGSTPDNIAIRKEGWWSQLKRRWGKRNRVSELRLVVRPSGSDCKPN